MEAVKHEFLIISTVGLKCEAKAHIKTDLNGTQNEGSGGASEITALQKENVKKQDSKEKEEVGT